MLTFCNAQLCKQNANQDIGRLSMYGPYFVRSLRADAFPLGKRIRYAFVDGERVVFLAFIEENTVYRNSGGRAVHSDDEGR